MTNKAKLDSGNQEFTTISIFVSSPSDCAEHRSAVKKLIHRLSNEEVCRSQKLKIRAIMWEDLPLAPEIRAMHKHILIDCSRNTASVNTTFNVGFMKDRVGTPTKDAVSGTADELV